MAPLGVGSIQLLNDTQMSTQDAIKQIEDKIQRLQRSKSSLEDNRRRLHKYILLIFCICCRHLWIKYKEKQLAFISATEKHEES